MSIKERIQKYLDYKGIKTATMEREVGLSNGYWRKTKSISANIVSDILRVYSDLSDRWVLFGEGAMCCSSADDESIYHPSSDGTCNGLTTEEEGRKSESEQARFYKEQAEFYKEQAEFYKQQLDSLKGRQ